MYIIAGGEIAARRVADLHRQAARQRLLRELRASRRPAVQLGPRWEWPTLRSRWSAVMARTPRDADGRGMSTAG